MKNLPIEKYLDHCIDSIINTSDHIIVGAYDYNNTRSGMVAFLDQYHNVIKEFETSGTLNIFERNGIIYAANNKNISTYNINENLKKVDTEAMNTYIYCGSKLFVSDTSRFICIYYYDLTLQEKIKFSADSIRVVKEIKGLVFVG